ncbi:hypothetical protein TNCV_946921 [Trichonephila clavipes]|nr:hypothetical protein TNCV_946921 [Trichonephila clavipes]
MATGSYMTPIYSRSQRIIFLLACHQAYNSSRGGRVIMTDTIESLILVLVPLKTPNANGLMHFKSVKTRSPLVGVVRTFEECSAS